MVSNLKKIEAKMDNREIKMIVSGHAEDHAGDVHRFWNPNTKKMIISSDVRWTNTIVNHSKPVNNRKLILRNMTDFQGESEVDQPMNPDSEEETTTSSDKRKMSSGG